MEVEISRKLKHLVDTAMKEQHKNAENKLTFMQVTTVSV